MTQLMENLRKFRFVRFGIIGACASTLQVLTLRILTVYGIPDPAANAAGIVAGALLSFPLSKRFTWGDRSVNNQAVAWTTFMAIAACAFAANEGMFIAARYLGVSRIPASLFGIGTAILVTWTGNNRLTFRERKSDKEVLSAIMPSDHYDIDLSIILPALNEARHIAGTLDQLAEYLEIISLGVVEVIVVAAEGGDNTAAIAWTRANAFQYFRVITPGPIVGKGRDVRVGMLNARGRYRMFMDVDLATPLRHLWEVQEFIRARGQVGIGVRRMGRYHNSSIRNFISLSSSLLTILFVVPIKDPRCGFKIFEAEVAERLFSRIRLLRWGFDIEVLAMARKFGYTITTFMVPDWYDPREARQGLANEKLFGVILGNMFDPFKVRWNLFTGKYAKQTSRQSHAKRTTKPIQLPVRIEEGRDNTARWVALAAFLASVSAYVLVALHHELLRFSDAASYMLIARRTIDGSTPGLAQLGSSWLPLPDLLQLPFAWSNPMYRTGLAGSISSMAAYVLSCVLLYRIVYRYTGKKIAGLIAASVFGLSFNVLYLQSTPMTEMLMFASIIGAVYCMQQWIDTDNYRWLTASGAAAFAASLTRYEAWPIVALLVVTAVIVAYRERADSIQAMLRRRRARDRVILTLLFAFGGIVAWLIYNQVIFHSYDSFLTGNFSHPAIGGGDPANHSWKITLLTYLDAVVDTVGLPVIILGAVGLVVFGINELIRKRVIVRAMPIMTLLAVIPFYLLTIYSGQRPLDVTQINGYNYNVRYGMLALLPAAIFIGYLVSVVAQQRLLLYPALTTVAAVVLGYGTITVRQGIAPLVGIEHATRASLQAAQAFERDYHGGLVLMELWGNEAVAFNAVPVNEIIWEGSNGLWEPALRSPIHNGISVIVARCSDPQPDLVCTSINRGEMSHYRKVWSNDVYTIYMAREKPFAAVLASKG